MLFGNYPSWMRADNGISCKSTKRGILYTDEYPFLSAALRSNGRSGYLIAQKTNVALADAMWLLNRICCNSQPFNAHAHILHGIWFIKADEQPTTTTTHEKNFVFIFWIWASCHDSFSSRHHIFIYNWVKSSNECALNTSLLELQSSRTSMLSDISYFEWCGWLTGLYVCWMLRRRIPQTVVFTRFQTHATPNLSSSPYFDWIRFDSQFHSLQYIYISYV